MKKKIGTTLELIGIRGNINYSKYTVIQFKGYLNDIDCQEIIDIHTEEMKKWEKVLSEYRQDITFLKANRTVRYRKVA